MPNSTLILPLTLNDDLDLCTQNVQLHEIHMHAKHKASTCTFSKVMANVKVGLKQTNKQTDRATRKSVHRTQMPPVPCTNAVFSINQGP